jgi:hypothetical protein
MAQSAVALAVSADNSATLPGVITLNIWSKALRVLPAAA